MPEALLIHASSSSDANLLYATKFLVGDPVSYIEIGGKKVILLNDLELGRGRSEAKVDEVVSLTAVEKELKDAGNPKPTHADILARVLEQKGADRVIVPGSFPLEMADQLRGKGLPLTYRKDPFYPQRMIKSDEELAHIKEAVKFTEASFEKAFAVLRETEIRGKQLFWKGTELTAEKLKRVIDGFLFENDLLATHTIVACGDQGTDPHCRGFGPLRPHETIIIDIFPKSLKTGYVGDMTRTVVKGKATDAAKKVDAAVRAAFDAGVKTIKAGVDSKEVHNAVVETFKKLNMETKEVNGKPTGFFHGTGHGIGLDVHESPPMGKRGMPLEAGMVITVEPGLYYPGVGAVRIEDDVVVTKTGCVNLCTLTKQLEIP